MVSHVESMQEVLCDLTRVRNMSVIAHVDHGKTTLTDSLLSRAGVISADQAGSKCATDTRDDEVQRGITIKSTAVSLHYTLSEEEAKGLQCLSSSAHTLVEEGEATGAEAGAPSVRSHPAGEKAAGERHFLVNLIDCPGHVDFSSEVTAALRVTDGAMVVVDCINGVCVQTETVLRQALSEFVRPCLMMNKLDRSILERQLQPEDLYQHLHQIINNVNSLVQVYGDADVTGAVTLNPSTGNVAFGSGLHGWGFSLPQFARMYSKRMGIHEARLCDKLWGDNFYNPDTKKWSKTSVPGSVRGFNKFVLEPIYKMLDVTLKNDRAGCESLCKKIGVHVPRAVLEECESLGDGGGGKMMMQHVMKRWIPAGDAMLYMILDHLPDPKQAQKIRIPALYEGPMDDEVALAMQACDPAGPLMIYISKMIPSADKSRFFAFGRVFSGTIRSAMNVRIQGPDYVPGANKDLYIKNVTGVKLPTVSGLLSAGAVPCGTVVALGGVDKCLVKSGTITTYQAAHNMKVMKFSVSPVVRVAVEVKQPADLPKLVKGMQRLEKAEPLVQCIIENGEHIVAGAGELHLEICLNDLENEFANVPLKRSNPVVSYKETVTQASPSPCLAKSGNKHNRLYITAQPLPEGLPEAIESGDVTAADDKKERSRFLADNFGFDATEMRKLWAFGPEGSGPNFLVDTSKGLQHLNDIKDAVVAGFQWATSEGVLCEEGMRGVQYNLTDAVVHSDPACRKGGQIIPTARRAFMAAQLTAAPRLVEPVYLVEIQTCQSAMGGVYSVINRRRGVIIEEAPRPGTPLVNIKAFLPVAESFGFTETLRGATGGQAFPQLVFDHWQVLPGDPLDPSSSSAGVVREIRTRKGLDPKIPALENYLDRL